MQEKWNKTLQDLLLVQHDQLLGSKSNCALCPGAENDFIVDCFPVTAEFYYKKKKTITISY